MTRLKLAKKETLQHGGRLRKFFGAVDPNTDGKGGELLLYLLVEEVLGTPMIAHKIKSVSDAFNDQVKGSDGVFFGQYGKNFSFLFGESKIYKNLNDGANNALESIDKFYDSTKGGPENENELFVIKQTRTQNLSIDQIKFIEKLLDINSAEYRSTNVVHPILIVYDENKISDIEIQCDNSAEGEVKVKEEFKTLAMKLLEDLIIPKMDQKWNNLKKVHLDFFFLPVTSVEKFRNSFFRAIHGMDYPRKEGTEKRNTKTKA